MRSITLALMTLALASVAQGAPRHAPVVVVTPPRDGQPLLTRQNDGRPRVHTVTRVSGSQHFHVPATGVPEEGPLRYGIDPSKDGALIAVRTREPLPVLLISPYERINDRTREQVRRDFPYARRVDTITHDLRRAQHQYLRESGLILKVRTFRADTPRNTTGTARPATRVLAPDESLNVTPSRVIPSNQSPE